MHEVREHREVRTPSEKCSVGEGQVCLYSILEFSCLLCYFVLYCCTWLKLLNIYKQNNDIYSRLFHNIHAPSRSSGAPQVASFERSGTSRSSEETVGKWPCSYWFPGTVGKGDLSILEKTFITFHSIVFEYVHLPGVTQECFLEALKYLKTSSYSTPSKPLVNVCPRLSTTPKCHALRKSPAKGTHVDSHAQAPTVGKLRKLFCQSGGRRLVGWLVWLVGWFGWLMLVGWFVGRESNLKTHFLRYDAIYNLNILFMDHIKIY